MKIKINKGTRMWLLSTAGGYLPSIVSDRDVEFDISETGSIGTFRIYKYKIPYPKYNGIEIQSVDWSKESEREIV